jgi:hypothetical protein
MNSPDSFRDDDAFGNLDDITWEPQPVCRPRLDRGTASNVRGTFVHQLAM